MKKILQIMANPIIMLIVVQTLSCSDDSDSGEYVSHGGKTYKTVKIGSQVWMAENLNYETESGSACFGGKEENCNAHGRTYTWTAAMGLPERCETTCPDIMPMYRDIYRQGVCPDGWHVPTRIEWDALFNYAGGPTVAAKHLKSMEGWDSCGPASAGNEFNMYSCEDTFGFRALPGGAATNGESDSWWSASQTGTYAGTYTHYYSAYAWSARYNQDNIAWGGSSKGGSHYVRCIRGGEKCGDLMYNEANTSLRCRNNNTLQTRCGANWYNTTDSTKRCQSYYITNSHREAQCGNYIYHIDNPNFRCENNTLEVLCETGWLSHAEHYTDEECYAAEMSDREYVVETMCGSEWYNAADENLRCHNEELETKCGNRWRHAFNPNIRCQNETLELQCMDGWHNYDDYYMKDACFGSMEDQDGTKYKTVKIGTQIWMAENLNYRPATGSSQCNADAIGPNLFCLAPGGRLYTWEAAMAACPEGWRLPTEQDWEVLDYSAGGYSLAGKHLKAKQGWATWEEDGKRRDRYYVYPSDSNGVDIFGFAALPGSRDRYDGDWWTPTETLCSGDIGDGVFRCAVHASIFADSDSLYLHFRNANLHNLYSYKTTYRSVRCIKK